MQLPDGLYDKLVTESVAKSIAGLREAACRTLAALPPEAASARIADALAKQLTVLLDDLGGDAAEKAKRQIELVNSLLVHLKQQAPPGSVDSLTEPAQVLQAVHSAGLYTCA